MQISSDGSAQCYTKFKTIKNKALNCSEILKNKRKKKVTNKQEKSVFPLFFIKSKQVIVIENEQKQTL